MQTIFKLLLTSSIVLVITSCSLNKYDCEAMSGPESIDCYRAELERIKDKLRPLAASSECRTTQDCSARPIGQKGCGGPNGYVVTGLFRSATDEALWETTARRVGEIDNRIIEIGNFGDTCEYYSPPESLSCIENTCVALAAEYQWKDYLK